MYSPLLTVKSEIYRRIDSCFI